MIMMIQYILFIIIYLSVNNIKYDSILFEELMLMKIKFVTLSCICIELQKLVNKYICSFVIDHDREQLYVCQIIYIS